MLVSLLPCRTSHSRAKAEAAVTAAQKAQEEARIARITAKEFSPSFQHRENGQSLPGPALAALNTPQTPNCPCLQLPILTRAPGWKKLSGIPGLGRFRAELSISSSSSLFRTVFPVFPLSPQVFSSKPLVVAKKEPSKGSGCRTDDPRGHH